MIGHLKHYLLTVANIDAVLVNDIVKMFRIKQVTRGTLLVNCGDTCKEFYFIGSGCIRTFFVTAAGNQRTRFIAFEGAAGTALSSFITQTPSTEMVEALEDSTLYAINHHNFHQLLTDNPGWVTFYNRFLERAYVHQHQKLQNLSTLTAAQRYQKLQKAHPEYVQRLSNKVLASYLDMREETLSRLKAK